MSGGMVGAAHLSANAGNGSASPPWYNFISGMQRSPGSSGAKVAREATKNTIATSPPKIAGQNADARALPWNVSSPAGFFGMDQPHQGPLPSDLAAIANQHKPNTGMMIWDKSLDFMESPLVYGAYWLRDGKKIVTAFSGPIGQMIKGGPGALAGKTALTGALKSLGGGLVAGVIGSLVGQWVGTKAGHWVMGDLLGWNKMAGDGPNPATVGMEIAHTSRWATIGAQVLGAAVALGIGIFMIATGPVGWVAFALIATAAAAAAGGSAFSAAASQYGEPAGQIIEGSPDVFFESRAVACVGHEIACDRHGTGHHLREGSETVFANGRPITRVGHGTTCNGKVNGGVDSVGIDMTTSAIQLPVVADMWDMIGRTALVVCEVASVGYDKWGPRVKPKPPATPPAPEAPTPPPSRPNPVNTPKSPTGTNPGGAGTGTGTPPVVAGAGAAKPAVPVTPSTRPATQPALPPGKPAPLALPAPKTPAALPAAKTPPALPAPKTPAALPAPKTPAALPAPKTQLALPAPKTPAALPAAKTPPALPAPKTPAALPAPKTQLALPAPKTPAALPAAKTPPALPAPKTPPALPAGKPAQAALPPGKPAPAIDPTPAPRPNGASSVGTSGNKPPSAQVKVGDPVDVVTGQFIDQRRDLMIPGTIPLELVRTHAPDSTGIQGRGWAGTWAQHLRIEANGLVYQNPDGTLIRFHTPRNEVLSHNLEHPHLEMMGQLNGTLHIFDYRSQLAVSFTRRHGTHLLLDAISDLNGNRIRFDYDDEGLMRVSHSDGFALRVRSRAMLIREAVLEGAGNEDCRVLWDYTPSGRLASVDSAQTGRLGYRHDSADRVIGWHDGAGTQVHYAYDARGRITRTWSDSGHHWATLEYHPTQSRSSVAGPDGIEHFDYDARGLVVRRTDPLGGVWLTEWNRFTQKLSETDPLGQATQWRYDQNGNMTSVTDPDGNVTRMTYGPDRQLATHTDPMGATRRIARDPRGNIVRIDEADGSFLRLRRGERGEVQRVEHPCGGQERFYYDALLRPRMHRTLAGQERHLGHDTEGRLLWRRDEIGAETRYDVTRGPDNPLGHVRAVIRPDGSTSRAAYDARGRQIAVTDGEGAVQRYEYGAFDLLNATTDALGHVTRFDYDAEGRLTTLTNPRGERFVRSYDAAGRLTAERDFGGLVTRYVHDAVGRVTLRLAPDATETHFYWSAGGRVIASEVVGDGSDGATDIANFDYDPCGRMVRADNGQSVVEYGYDVLGRVIREAVDGREIRSEHGPAGRTARRGDVLALSAGYRPDHQIERLVIGGFAPLGFSYDLRGQEVARTSDAGFALAQGYGINGLLAEQVAGPQAELPIEARLGALDGGNPGGALMRGGARLHRSYHWDRADRATRIDDRVLGVTALDYDARGQVTASLHSGRGAAPLRALFDYDPARDLAQITAAGVAEPVIARAGRIRRRGRVSYRHDDCGRVIEKRVEAAGFRPRTWRMQWDGRGQLARLETPDGSVWHYAYDPLGRRIRALRALPDGSGAGDDPCGRAWQWEGERIIAEAPVCADGTVAWDRASHWVYGEHDFAPVAQVTDGALHYIVTDHIGTPREMLSEDGAEVVWRARLTFWGEMAELRAANDNSPRCPIRFQGQWADDESGLHYNRFRYYDPEATQYLSPDPLRLEGGMRPQAYVSDPNSRIDPLGLQERTHITYRGIDAATGKPYVGYASKPGAGHSFAEVLDYRYSAGYDRFEGGTPPRELYVGDSKPVARGLEQRVFEQEGGLAGTANKKNPVGPHNANRTTYLDAADVHQQSHPYKPVNRPGCP